VPERSLRGLIQTLLRVGATSLAAFRFELIPFALFGVWALTRRERRPWRGWLIGLPIVLYSGLLVLLVWGEGYVSRRHALPPWLPLLALAALGWRVAFDALVARRSIASGWASVALVAILVLVWGARDLRERRVERAPVRIAAEWLAAERPESGAVAAQKLRTAYYAGADFVPLMPGLDGRLAPYLDRRKAKWVIIDEAKLADHQGLEEGLGDWLESVHSVSSDGRRILVLAIGRPD
jgi:hypothetical protein